MLCFLCQPLSSVIHLVCVGCLKRCVHKDTHWPCLQVGPQGVGLKVKDPKKYNFDPKSLLLQICEVCMRICVMQLLLRILTV